MLYPISKIDLLFHLRNYFDMLSYEDIQEILENTIEYYQWKEYENHGLKLKLKNDIKCEILSDYNVVWLKRQVNSIFYYLHRDNKPAVIYKYKIDGPNQFWKNGIFIKYE